MAELNSLKRNNLSDKSFGIPSLRKFPLNDEEHVRKAIQMFHHCPLQYKKELAKNIYKKTKIYNITIKNDSPIYDYLPNNIKEDIDFIFIDEEWNNKFISLIEEFIVNETEAQQKVENAINGWKERKKYIRNEAEKNSLLVDIKNETTLISNYQRKGDYSSIIQRAGQTANKLSNNIKNRRASEKMTTSTGAHIKSGVSNVKTGYKIAGAVATGAVAGLGTKKIMKATGSGVVKRNVKAAKVGTTTALVGGALAVGSSLYNDRKASDPNKGIRQYAEKYANFIQGFSDEVKETNLMELNQQGR